MLTRDQAYAISAHERVLEVKKRKDEGDERYRGYGSMSHKLPILIRTSGLAQALTFLQARGRGLQPQLLDDLARTVGKESGDDLANSARAVSLPEYMLLTRQVMDALLWYKRFAQSLLDVEAGDESEEEIEDRQKEMSNGKK